MSLLFLPHNVVYMFAELGHGSVHLEVSVNATLKRMG